MSQESRIACYTTTVPLCQPETRNKMTELKIKIMKVRIEEFENAFPRSIAEYAEGDHGVASEFEEMAEKGRHAFQDHTRSSATSPSGVRTASATNQPALTAASLATRATGPFQLEVWARQFEHHESTAYLMEWLSLSDHEFTLGDQNPSIRGQGEEGQDSNHQLPLSGYPKSLDENDLVPTDVVEANLDEVKDGPTSQSQQGRSCRESKIKQEENAAYIIRAPHLQQDTTINLQAQNITPRNRQ